MFLSWAFWLGRAKAIADAKAAEEKAIANAERQEKMEALKEAKRKADAEAAETAAAAVPVAAPATEEIDEDGCIE